VKHARIGTIGVALALTALGAGCRFNGQGPQVRANPTVMVVTPAPSPSPAPAGASEENRPSTPEPDIERQLRQMEDQVSLLRGLALTKRVPLALVTPDELQSAALDACTARVTGDTLAPETLAMLGILGPDVDLSSDEASLAADWAASLMSRYNEAEVKIELLDPATLDPAWRLDYIAAYLSALRAQAIDGPAAHACCPMACAAAGDAGLASAALTLGDTRLAMEQWVRVYGDTQDAVRFGSLLEPAEEASLFRAPDFLRETYNFLLTGGRAFVQELYLSGDWEKVNQAYADPPVSTEQILHPDRYPEDVPLHLEAPDPRARLGPEWGLRQSTVLGEWRMRQALQAYLPADEAIDATSDWGGDVLLTYHNQARQQDLLLLITRWDNLRQAQDFFLAFRKYGEARFGERHPVAGVDTWTWDGGYVALEHASDQTLWIMAPDRATAEAARDAFEFPVQNR
jgi:hypothetical protein